MYLEITMYVWEREELIFMPGQVLRLMARERARRRRMRASSLVVGGGLYRVRHPLTSYVTKKGINAIMSVHYKTSTMRMMLRLPRRRFGLRISE
jgi:hypothetical protein